MNRNTGSGVSSLSGSRVESPAISDFAKTMAPRPMGTSSRRLNLDQEKKKNGLAQLVLTVVKLLHELLEKQAIRRIDGGGLTDEEIERLGFTLMRQSEEIAKDLPRIRSRRRGFESGFGTFGETFIAGG